MTNSKVVVPKIPAFRFPTMRSAMWLYLIVVFGTFLGYYVPAQNAPRTLLALIVGIFVTGGFTAAAVFINQISIPPLLGPRPKPILLILSFMAGLAVWVLAFWVFTVIAALLSSAVGALQSAQQAQLSSQLDAQVPAGVEFLVIAVVTPVTQGLLFWGYIRRGAQPLGKMVSAILVVVLFGLYGFYSRPYGMSEVVEMLIVGIVCGAVVYFTDSPWCAVLVLSGYNLAVPLLLIPLLNYLNSAAEAGNPFSGRWFLIVAASAFVTFLFIQVLRARVGDKQADVVSKAPLRRSWWLPLIAAMIFSLFVGYLEIVTRESNPTTDYTPVLSPGSGSTNPPIRATPSPQPTPTAK